jgi:prolipoprotein diacylglyceryltransferase
MEFTLLGSAAIAVAFLYGMLWWEGKRGNVLECSRSLWDIALTAAVVGVFTGRIAAMIGDGVNPVTNPADLLIVRAGVATGWASLAALATVAWLGRAELWQVLDGLAAAGLAGLAGWHAGCVTRDACLGSASDLPWAMTQPGSSVSRHPVELYAALALALAAPALAAWRRRSLPPPGVPAAIALAVAGAVRIVTEPLRPSLGTGPVGWYAAAILAGLAMIVWRVRATTATAASA